MPKHKPLAAVILAAGEGTRMKSQRPKPLHKLCGQPMVAHVLDAVAGVNAQHAVVVVGHGAERVTKTVQAVDAQGLQIDFVEQPQLLGTGDAVSVALTALSDDEDQDLLVLPGDTPLLRAATLQALVDEHRSSDAAATILTAVIDDPAGYGRVIRGRDDVVDAIVEHRDATPEEREIHEINSSIYCFRQSVLGPALRRITPANAQGEYYLTDVIAVLRDAGYTVRGVVADDATETSGINDRGQLAAAEAELRARINASWLSKGVTMIDPAQTYIDATVSLAEDVSLLPGTMLRGSTSVGRGTEIGPNCRLIDTKVGAGCRVENTVARNAVIGDGARVGPFAVLERGDRVDDGVTTGPFYNAKAPE